MAKKREQNRPSESDRVKRKSPSEKEPEEGSLEWRLKQLQEKAKKKLNQMQYGLILIQITEIEQKLNSLTRTGDSEPLERHLNAVSSELEELEKKIEGIIKESEHLARVTYLRERGIFDEKESEHLARVTYLRERGIFDEKESEHSARVTYLREQGIFDESEIVNVINNYVASVSEANRPEAMQDIIRVLYDEVSSGTSINELLRNLSQNKQASAPEQEKPAEQPENLPPLDTTTLKNHKEIRPLLERLEQISSLLNLFVRAQFDQEISDLFDTILGQEGTEDDKIKEIKELLQAKIDSLEEIKQEREKFDNTEEILGDVEYVHDGSFAKPRQAKGRNGDVAWATDRGGRPKKESEDSIYINLDKNVFVVIDGMGGHDGGKRSAEIVAEAWQQAVAEQQIQCERFPANQKMGDDKRDGIRQMLRLYRIKQNKIGQNDPLPKEDQNEINRVVAEFNNSASFVKLDLQEKAQTNIGQECGDGGAVYSAAVIVGDKLHVFHVGDTTVAVIGENGIVRFCTAPLGIGSIVLTAVRSGEEVLAKHSVVDLWPGDKFVLCSDGVIDDKNLSIKDVARTVHGKSPSKAMEEFHKILKKQGKPDNRSVIVGEYAYRAPLEAPVMEMKESPQAKRQESVPAPEIETKKPKTEFLPGEIIEGLGEEALASMTNDILLEFSNKDQNRDTGQKFEELFFRVTGFDRDEKYQNLCDDAYHGLVYHILTLVEDQAAIVDQEDLSSKNKVPLWQRVKTFVKKKSLPTMAAAGMGLATGGLGMAAMAAAFGTYTIVERIVDRNIFNKKTSKQKAAETNDYSDRIARGVAHLQQSYSKKQKAELAAAHVAVGIRGVDGSVIDRQCLVLATLADTVDNKDQGLSKMEYALAAIRMRNTEKKTNAFSEKIQHTTLWVEIWTELKQAAKTGKIKGIWQDDEKALKRVCGDIIEGTIAGTVGATVGLAGGNVGFKAAARFVTGGVKGFLRTFLRGNAEAGEMKKEEIIKEAADDIQEAQENFSRQEELVRSGTAEQSLPTITTILVRLKGYELTPDVFVSKPSMIEDIRLLIRQYETLVTAIKNQGRLNQAIADLRRKVRDQKNSHAGGVNEQLTKRTTKETLANARQAIRAGTREGGMVALAGAAFDFLRSDTFKEELDDIVRAVKSIFEKAPEQHIPVVDTPAPETSTPVDSPEAKVLPQPVQEPASIPETEEPPAPAYTGRNMEEIGDQEEQPSRHGVEETQPSEPVQEAKSEPILPTESENDRVLTIGRGDNPWDMMREQLSKRYGAHFDGLPPGSKNYVVDLLKDQYEAMKKDGELKDVVVEDGRFVSGNWFNMYPLVERAGGWEVVEEHIAKVDPQDPGHDEELIKQLQKSRLLKKIISFLWP